MNTLTARCDGVQSWTLSEIFQIPPPVAEQTGVVVADDVVLVGDALHDDDVRGCPGGPMAPRPPSTPPSPPPPYAVVSTAATGSGISGDIPLEIVSEEEMALIEAAMASARCLLRASSFHCSRVGSAAFSPLSSAVPPLRRCSRSYQSTVPVILSQKGSSSQDIEDAGVNASPSKSLLQRFRSKRALTVTDLTTTEWCEKQMEYYLLRGKREMNKAMRAGIDRHAELEKEVVQKVEISVKTKADSWAVKFLNFVFGTHQLLFEGLTRELPVLGIVEGEWVVGVIDEIRMPLNEAVQHPLLVDTKTRCKATLPTEAQMRNSRFQLMCYKYLWDYIVAVNFPSGDFYKFFHLDPQSILSEDVGEYSARLGLCAKKLEDVVNFFTETCYLLPSSQEKLMLRYEYQMDNSLIKECIFDYDANWFKGQISKFLEFWSGVREASLVPKEEEWKCQYCDYKPTCRPVTARSDCS